jgi:hypothetical protein
MDRFQHKIKERKPLAIPRRSWENNIKISLMEIRCEDWSLIEVTQDRLYSELLSGR